MAIGGGKTPAGTILKGLVRIFGVHTRREHIVPEHSLNKIAVTHTGEDDMCIYGCNPPEDERVWFRTIHFVTKKRNTPELIDVFGPEREATGFTCGNLSGIESCAKEHTRRYNTNLVQEQNKMCQENTV